jgi:hypothetical protein
LRTVQIEMSVILRGVARIVGWPSMASGDLGRGGLFFLACRDSRRLPSGPAAPRFSPPVQRGVAGQGPHCISLTTTCHCRLAVCCPPAIYCAD